MLPTLRLSARPLQALAARRCHAADAFVPARHGQFYQQPVRIADPYAEDPFLQRFVKLAFDGATFDAVDADLRQFGRRVPTEVHELHDECEIYPPVLEQFDCWGNRIDRIRTCRAWRDMKRLSALEGFVGVAYDAGVGNRRLYATVKNFLYAPSSGMYGCPLAMTDGAAKTLQLMDGRHGNGLTPELREAFERLTSRDPDRFWTSGQWMTERAGGSDVGDGTDTVAVPQQDGSYRLHGFKWFSSATDADVTLTLARVAQADGSVQAGSGGLSLFFARVRDNEGRLNGVQMVRLKNKFGTRQLPTAELLLTGCSASLIGQPGRGVAEISPMLLMTRLHNSVHAAAALRRLSHLCRRHSLQRVAFRRPVASFPLHVRSLADLELHARAACLLTFRAAQLLGEQEAGKNDENSKQLLRLMSPLVKLFTAKQAVVLAQEAMEMFGGVGYIEESGLPGIVRDANVLPIWEGTTNILSLDLLRAVAKSEGRALPALRAEVADACDAAGASCGDLRPAAERVNSACDRVLAQMAEVKPDRLQHAARDLAMCLSRMCAAAQLLRLAAATGHSADVEAARRWCRVADFDGFGRAQQSGDYDAEAERLLALEDA